jgi:hypothetical protein
MNCHWLGPLVVLAALAPASAPGQAPSPGKYSPEQFEARTEGGVKVAMRDGIRLTGTDDLGQAVDQTLPTDGDGAYVFLDLRPGSYYLTRTTQPAGYTPGIDSVGTAGGGLSAAVADQFFVQLAQGVNGLNYNYGEVPAATGPVQKGQTAGIGFWNNKNGQALILALNGGGASHQLGDWLAATFVNLYEADSGNDLAGKSNAYVAALFQQDFLAKGQKLDAQVLATALAVYVTNATLDPLDPTTQSNAATRAGFVVSGDGVGAATWSVGANGDAFGVANNTSMTVMDLLLATDDQAMVQQDMVPMLPSGAVFRPAGSKAPRSAGVGWGGRLLVFVVVGGHISPPLLGELSSDRDPPSLGPGPRRPAQVHYRRVDAAGQIDHIDAGLLHPALKFEEKCGRVTESAD